MHFKESSFISFINIVTDGEILQRLWSIREVVNVYKYNYYFLNILHVDTLRAKTLFICLHVAYKLTLQYD
jgi:hypothetical protein